MKNFISPVCFAASLLLAATAVQAQTQHGSVVQVPQRPAPATITPATPGLGAPSPAGLASPTPSPGGLSSRFPAGLPSPSPFPVGMPPVASPTLPSPGSTVTPPADATVLSPAPATGGAGMAAAPAAAYGGASAGAGPSTPRSVPAGPGPYTALQLAKSFLEADANRDGELTRAEAQRLTIMPMSFEEMDRNKDGVISRSEYEDSTR